MALDWSQVHLILETEGQQDVPVKPPASGKAELPPHGGLSSLITKGAVKRLSLPFSHHTPFEQGHQLKGRWYSEGGEVRGSPSQKKGFK